MSQDLENDFLSHFRRMHAVQTTSKTAKKTEVYFMIKTEVFINGSSKTYLEVVDKSGKPVDVDFHLYTGHTFNLLRTLDTIRQEKRMQTLAEDDMK